MGFYQSYKTNRHYPSGELYIYTPRKKRRLRRENQPWMKMYDISPIQSGDFPACHVSFRGVTYIPTCQKKQRKQISSSKSTGWTVGWICDNSSQVDNIDFSLDYTLPKTNIAPKYAFPKRKDGFPNTIFKFSEVYLLRNSIITTWRIIPVSKCLIAMVMVSP